VLELPLDESEESFMGNFCLTRVELALGALLALSKFTGGVLQLEGPLNHRSLRRSTVPVTLGVLLPVPLNPLSVSWLSSK